MSPLRQRWCNRDPTGSSGPGVENAALSPDRREGAFASDKDDIDRRQSHAICHQVRSRGLTRHSS